MKLFSITIDGQLEFADAYTKGEARAEFKRRFGLNRLPPGVPVHICGA